MNTVIYMYDSSHALTSNRIEKLEQTVKDVQANDFTKTTNYFKC